MPWHGDMDALRAEAERARADGPSPMETDRWVRIMCDYGADGVWARDDRPGRAEALPISLDLMARLHRWEDLFESSDDWDRHGNRWTPEQDRRWSDEGLAIAIEMKRQLPGWTVVYTDGWRASRPDHPRLEDRRAYFEYEITDEVARTGRRPLEEAGQHVEGPALRPS